MKKRIFSLLTTLGMALSLFSTLPVMAWEYGEAGTASWLIGAENPSDIVATFTSSDPKNINTLGSFVIEGNGEMEDFLSAPWGWYQELITSVTISEGITSIGDNSFDHGFIKTNYYGGFSNLESITLPSTLTSIGKYAFSYCDKLKNVDLPDGLTSIHSQAFQACTGLTDITIPDSVTEIYGEVFSSCTNLTRVTIPDLNITYLGPNIFGNYERSENLTVYCYAGGQIEEYLKKNNINYVTIGQSSHVIDKSELEKMIAEAEKYDTSYSGPYTVESIDNLISARVGGRMVFESPNSTQEDVDDAVQRIKDAIENLVEKPLESPSETPKTDPSDTSSKPSSDNSSNNPTQPSSNDDTPTTSPTTDPTTAAKPATTAAPKATANVAAAKQAAKTAMNQAKITKLTVKSKKAKKITVTWKKVSKAVGYEVQVSSNKKFKKSKILVKKTVKKANVTIKNKKIKSKKTYYVRVRAYATYKDAKGATQNVYSSWNNKLRRVKVK